VVVTAFSANNLYFNDPQFKIQQNRAFKFCDGRLIKNFHPTNPLGEVLILQMQHEIWVHSCLPEFTFPQNNPFFLTKIRFHNLHFAEIHFA
jgi:hypothetical protein